MYLRTAAAAFAAGHGSAGVTAPATRWFLAEGATGPFFDVFILIGNPTNDRATVEAQFLLIGGGVITETYDRGQQPLQHLVDNDVRRAGQRGVSTTRDVDQQRADRRRAHDVVAGSVAGAWHEAHNASRNADRHRWALAEGEQGGPRNAETYILIANTSDFAGQARVRLLFEDGSTAERIYGMAANSRTNAQIGVDFPEAAGKRSARSSRASAARRRRSWSNGRCIPARTATLGGGHERGGHEVAVASVVRL